MLATKLQPVLCVTKMVAILQKVKISSGAPGELLCLCRRRTAGARHKKTLLYDIRDVTNEVLFWLTVVNLLFFSLFPHRNISHICSG